MVKTLSFGAVLWDIIENVEHIGGAPFNLAAHLSQLGADSHIVTRVGLDERGKLAQNEIKRIGVNSDLVQIDPILPTGTVLVALDRNGNPSYDLPEPVAYDTIQWTEKIAYRLKETTYDAFCFGTFDQRTPRNRETLERILSELKRAYVFLDINLRLNFYSRDIIAQSLSHANICKLNEDEVPVISPMLFKKYYSGEDFHNRIVEEYGIMITCLTKGENGCSIYVDGSHHSIAGVPVRVIDTVGSGDAFSAAFLYTLCKTGDPVKAAEHGNILGAFMASRRGAVPEYTDFIKGQLEVK